MTRLLLVAALSAGTAPPATAQSLRCDLTQYKPTTGLAATFADNQLVLSWRGEGHDLRLRLTAIDGRPVVRDLAIRKGTAAWAIIGENLTPSITW
jgi:hypothetical protein